MLPTRKGPPKYKNLMVHKLGNTHTGTICRELSFGFCDIWKDFLRFINSNLLIIDVKPTTAVHSMKLHISKNGTLCRTVKEGLYFEAFTSSWGKRKISVLANRFIRQKQRSDKGIFRMQLYPKQAYRSTLNVVMLIDPSSFVLQKSSG